MSTPTKTTASMAPTRTEFLFHARRVHMPVSAIPKDKSDCNICLNPLSDAVVPPLPNAKARDGTRHAPVQLPCGHFYGEDCIQSWFLEHNTCPECRHPAFPALVYEYVEGVGFGMCLNDDVVNIERIRAWYNHYRDTNINHSPICRGEHLLRYEEAMFARADLFFEGRLVPSSRVYTNYQQKGFVANNLHLNYRGPRIVDSLELSRHIEDAYEGLYATDAATRPTVAVHPLATIVSRTMDVLAHELEGEKLSALELRRRLRDRFNERLKPFVDRMAPKFPANWGGYLADLFEAVVVKFAGGVGDIFGPVDTSTYSDERDIIRCVDGSGE